MTGTTTSTAATSESLGQKIISGAQTALNIVETIGPVAALVGGPAVSSAVKIGTGVIEFVEAVTQAVESGQLALSSDDLATVQGLQTQLQAKNDALAALIEQS